MTDIKHIRNVSPQRGMPVDDKSSSSTIVQVTGEAVQLYFWSEGVRTIDAGEAVGVLVEAQLSQNNIKNASGAMEATHLDTSLSFVSTALTSEVEFPEIDAENADSGTGTGRLDQIAGNFSNGQYCVDYTNGTIFGKKASLSTNLDFITYNIQKLDIAATEPIEISADDGEAATEDKQRDLIGAMNAVEMQLKLLNEYFLIFIGDHHRLTQDDVTDSPFNF